MKTFAVDDVGEAVRLALRFQREGRYDWFRGQSRDRRLVPSLHRPGVDLKAARATMCRFNQWVRITPGLESLATEPDAQIAVAQHYGLPTPFIDFTTSPEVAGFFASYWSDDPRPAQVSCIVCLDTTDLGRFLEGLPNDLAGVELVTLDVSNLWRLQAQRGVFLCCPSDNFENFYDFDRILFPAKVRAPANDEARFFKVRKSQLEILLDQFLMNEQGRERLQSIQRHFDAVVTYETPRSAATNTSPFPSPPPALASWSHDQLDPWLVVADERHPEVIPSDHRAVDLGDDLDIAHVVSTARDAVETAIRNSAGLRARSVVWECNFDDPAIDPHEINRALRWLWDGLRSLPHSDADLAVALANCVALFAAGVNTPTLPVDHAVYAARAVFGDVIRVEFGSDDGGHSKAFVSRMRLAQCIRSDVDNYWASENLGTPVSPEVLLLWNQEPARLFEFAPFAAVVAQELAPAQVLFRPGGRPNAGPDYSAAFFSPARITRFGLP